MNPEEVLKLLDSCWFEHQVLWKKPVCLSSPPRDSNPDPEIQKSSPKRGISRQPTIHMRSKSDNLSSKLSFPDSFSFSPDSVLSAPKLETILSGKEITVEKQIEVSYSKKFAARQRRKKGNSESKSLSDLEFEELKGFMDLGFVFSEEDKNSSLASIIPGLQRLGREEEKAESESAVSRPYLSEAWDVMDTRREENPLKSWRIPALSNEVDMKHTLRLWAHAVASAVR